MNTTLCDKLAWSVAEKDVNDARAEIEAYAIPPSDPRKLSTRIHFKRKQAFLLFLYHYFLAITDEMRSAANIAISAAEDEFFGVWRTVCPSGNNGKEPPNPEYWHQQWGQDEHFVEAACVASCVDQWDMLQRFAKYMSEIKWDKLQVEARPGMLYIDLPDGREESAWRLILAGVIYGLRLDRELEPLVEIVLHGRCVRERILFRWLETLAEEQHDEEVQCRANEYFDYYLKHEVRQQMITAKVMIEGTLMVNYSRHLGRKLIVPESIGERYITVPREG